MKTNLFKYFLMVFLIKFTINIELSIYYESLCKPSIEAISFLSKTIDLLGGYEKIGDVKFIPFGFSTVKDNKIVKCQHGEEECYGNKLHSCANKILKQNIAYKFISCTIISVTNYVNQNKGVFYKIVKNECYKLITPENKNKIEKCSKGEKIEKFMIKNYYKSFKKNDIKGTPYFIINHIKNDIFNLMVAHKPLKILCDMLGESKPEICNLFLKHLQPHKIDDKSIKKKSESCSAIPKKSNKTSK